MEASYGSIYPALNQLAAEGLLTVREEEQSGKPDKKVYAITPNGLANLTKELSVVPPDATSISPNFCLSCCCSTTLPLSCV